MDIKQLLEATTTAQASDLHLIVGKAPTIRVHGSLQKIAGLDPLTPNLAEALIFSLLNAEYKTLLLNNRELDFSYATATSRFRVNIYFERGYPAAAFRLIPSKIKTLEELGMPTSLYQFSRMRQGFILVTGPTGHGKSTTLASMINEINQNREAHIVTIEDPIEYVYPDGQSIISQREMHMDTHSWDMALRAVLREDPDVVLVGEMRDYDTIASALTVAETGHLVFATLHTNSAAQTIDRIVDVFPDHQQGQIRTQLASSLEGIISQRLLPALGGGRVPAVELLLASQAVKTSIRDGKTHLIDNIISTSAESGMITLEKSLSTLVRERKISAEVAQQFALRPSELLRLLKEK